MRPFRQLIVASAFLFVTSLVLVPAASAQQTGSASKEDSGIGVGVEAMAAFPSLSNATSGLDAKTGYGFGLWVGGNRNGTVGFTGEFIYLVKKEEFNGATAKHYALEIPALFHINFGSRSKNGALGYAIVGPVFTVNVKDKLTGGLAGNNFSSANVGLIYGAGFEVARFAVEARMNQDFKTVTDNGGGVFADSKERRFEILGKFRFN